MSKHIDLTNEKLAKKFTNSFELVSSAIDLARHAVESGRDLSNETDIKNQAYQVLQQLLKEKEAQDTCSITEECPVEAESA